MIIGSIVLIVIAFFVSFFMPTRKAGTRFELTTAGAFALGAFAFGALGVGVSTFFDSAQGEQETDTAQAQETQLDDSNSNQQIRGTASNQRPASPRGLDSLGRNEKDMVRTTSERSRTTSERVALVTDEQPIIKQLKLHSDRPTPLVIPQGKSASILGFSCNVTLIEQEQRRLLTRGSQTQFQAEEGQRKVVYLLAQTGSNSKAYSAEPNRSGGQSGLPSRSIGCQGQYQIFS